MAIIDMLEAMISVEGENLLEYDCETEPESDSVTPTTTPKVKKYIETQEECRFSVDFNVHEGYSLHPDATHLSWDIHFDGKFIEGHLAKRISIDRKRLERSISSSKAKIRNKIHTRYFKFEKLEIAKEDVTLSEAEKYKQFGTIEVKVWPWRKTSLSDAANELYGKLPIVPERGVKLRAVTLGVGFQLEIAEDCGQLTPSANGSNIGLNPVAHFVFEYRTKESLQELGVIKQPPKPDSAMPLEERDVNTLTREELLELVKTRLPNPNQSTKRECDPLPADGDDITSRRAKRSRTAKQSHDVISID